MKYKRYSVILSLFLLVFLLAGCTYNSNLKIPANTKVTSAQNTSVDTKGGNTAAEKVNVKKEDVVTLITNNISALNNNDINSYMNTLDQNRKDFEDQRLYCENMFSNLDAQFSLSKVGVTSMVPSNITATATVNISGMSSSNPFGYSNGMNTIRYSISLNNNVYKITSETVVK